VTVTGNAVAVLGAAAADGSPAGGAAPAEQPGAEGSAALLDVDVPVLVCGTAVGVLGDAEAGCAAPGGAPDDSGSVVGIDAPVTVCGNAVGVLGDVAAGCAAPGGSTDGPGLEVGVDAPVTVCGIAVGVLGDASTTCAGPAAPVAPGTSVPPSSGRPDDSRGVVLAGGTAPVRGNGSAGWDTTGATAGTDGALAYTGSPVVQLLLGGLLALVLGLGLTLLGRRRAGGLG